MKVLGSIKGIWSKYVYILTSMQKKLGIFIFVMIVIGSALELIGVSIVLPFVQALLAPEELVQNPFVSSIANLLHLTTTNQIVILLTVGMILVYLVKNAYLSLLAWVKAKYWRKIEREVALSLLESYLKRPYTFHLETNSSVLIRSIYNDTVAISDMMMNLFTVVAEALSIIMIGLFIVYTDPWMALGLLTICGLTLIVILLNSRRTLRKQGELVLEYSAQCVQYLNQAFNGIKDVMVMRKQVFFANKFKGAIEKKNKATVLRTFAGESPAYIIETVCIAAFVGLLCIKVCNGDNSADFVAQTAAFAVAAFRILPSAGKITSNINSAVFYAPVLDDVYKNLHEVNQFNNAGHVILMQDKIEKIDFNKDIKINDIYFKYTNAEQDTLGGVSMDIQKGEAVALIGASGAGKSTMVDIILGLLKAQKGNIQVDGVDIADMPGGWSKLIGYVPQSVFLTDDTIRNNIAFGIEPTEIKDDQVWKVLEQAQLKEFVENLPDGLDTVVGERGIRFSGGQRQRVAIARALYDNPQILLLDEATSALDTETEQGVMEAIDLLHGHKTLIIVAHRLSTIQNCDRIFEIKEGQAHSIQKSEIFSEEEGSKA